MTTAIAEPSVIASFARHETFHPRYGWLKKGFDASREDYDVFNHPSATTLLGVGKNMVNAIRYWVLAYKLCEYADADAGSRVRRLVPTAFGSKLLDGWDPYLEDTASLWLLHWNLLKAPCRAPAWWALFHGRRLSAFTDDELVADLAAFCATQDGWDVARSSIEKDARCILRMYAGVTQGRDLPEDSIDSPFTDLELVQPLPGARNLYGVNLHRKPGLSDAVVVHSCLDFLARGNESGARTATLLGLATRPGSPGRTFGLPPALLAEAFERYAAGHTGLIESTHAAGVEQVVVPDDPAALAERVLDIYYKGTDDAAR